MNKSFVFLFMFFSLSTMAQDFGFGLSAGIGRRGIIRSKDYVIRSTLTSSFFYKAHPTLDIKLELDNIYTNRPQENLLMAWGANKWASGLVIGADYRIGRMFFCGGLGKYIDFVSVWGQHHPGDEILFYNKVGIKYQLKKYLLIGITMRSHKGQADYLDFGMSIRVFPKLSAHKK